VEQPLARCTDILIVSGINYSPYLAIPSGINGNGVTEMRLVFSTIVITVQQMSVSYAAVRELVENRTGSTLRLNGTSSLQIFPISLGTMFFLFSFIGYNI